MATVGKTLRRGGLYALVSSFAFFGAFPFYWMVIASFKRDHDLYNPTSNPFLFNEPATLDHLRLLLFDTHFVTYLLNTFRVGIAVVVITLAVAVPAAYSLAFYPTKRSNFTLTWMISTRMLPPVGIILPFFVIFKNLPDPVFSCLAGSTLMHDGRAMQEYHDLHAGLSYGQLPRKCEYSLSLSL